MKRLPILIGCLLLAFWPVWVWYVQRISDGSDEPYGILALLAGFWLIWRDRSLLRYSHLNGLVAVGLLLVFAMMAPMLPDLFRAIIAVGILAIASGSWKRNPGIWMVFALSLPLIASMQFYLGFPLRWIAAVSAEGILQAAGLELGRAGTTLLWKGNAVGVDPPCSGVEMLWVGLFLVAFFGAFRRYSPGRFIVVMAVGAGAIVGANCLRVAMLFIKESGMLNLPAWTHEGIGIVIFVALVLLAEKHFPPGTELSNPEAEGASRVPSSRFFLPVVAAISISVAVQPMVSGNDPVGQMGSEEFPGWPEKWDGKYLEALSLTESEESFAENFPGRIGVFSNGPDKVILRWVTQATRKLHSSADCLRASGYQIEEERSGSFIAWNDEAIYCIEEKISNETGEWSGVSRWFWSATFGKTKGPWWAATTIRPYPN